MSVQKLTLPLWKAGKPRHVCEACGVVMRIRLTGPVVLEGNRQEAIYVCECGHEQRYVECLQPEPALGEDVPEAAGR